MTSAQDLLDAQRARMVALDAELPGSYRVPNGDPIVTRLPDGSAVAGVVSSSTNPPGSLRGLWSAAETFELFPLVGDRPQEGMNALLDAWRTRLRERGVSETDSACVVTWPSRDVEATRAFLDHGLVPLSCLAVRAPAPDPNADLHRTVTIRRAGAADLDRVVELSMAELNYAALVGGSTARPEAARLKRTAIGVRLYSDDPVWLAERDGAPIALAECGWTDTANHHSGRWLRAGRWGYVNCLSVTENERGAGIGGQLVALAHNEFARAEVLGTYLYYNPANPLSSVFWPRRGYRPLWTMWEVRPATALR